MEKNLLGTSDRKPEWNSCCLALSIESVCIEKRRKKTRKRRKEEKITCCRDALDLIWLGCGTSSDWL